MKARAEAGDPIAKERYTPLGVHAIWWFIPIGWILADIVGQSIIKCA